MDGNLTIFDKDHDAVEEGRSQTEAFATIAMYSRWQLGEIERVPNSKSAVMHMAVQPRA